MDDRPAQISNLGIPFLKVLERALGFVRGMAGQMDLPVFADDAPRFVDQDGRIEPALPAILHDGLGIADLEADFQAGRFVEQRLRLRPRHVPLEEEIDIFLPFEEPPRKNVVRASSGNTTRSQPCPLASRIRWISLPTTSVLLSSRRIGPAGPPPLSLFLSRRFPLGALLPRGSCCRPIGFPSCVMQDTR